MKKPAAIALTAIFGGISMLCVLIAFLARHTDYKQSAMINDHDVRMTIPGLIIEDVNRPMYLCPWKSWNDDSSKSDPEKFRKWLLSN